MIINYSSEIKLDNFQPKSIEVSINPKHLHDLHQTHTWSEVAKMYDKSERTIYRWISSEIKVKQKEGRKFKVDEEDRKFLADYAKKNNDQTQWNMADYFFQEKDIAISQQTVSRILREQKVTNKEFTYHYEQIASQKEINDFIDKIRGLPTNQLLALDECGFHLNENPRRGYSLKGTRAITKKPSHKGKHYTLLLCIANWENEGVVYYQLIEGGAKTKNFYDFLEGINLPNDWKYYLLLDNAKIHYAPDKRKELGLPTISEQMAKKNIKVKYFPRYTPQLNPAELCFNFLRNKVERKRSRNLEQLRSFIDKAMKELNQKDMTEYFRHCWDYFRKNTDISYE